jgi:hypothetical protein
LFSLFSGKTFLEEIIWQNHIIQIKKRNKELVRKERKEQKRQQKLDRAKKRSEQDSVHFQEEMENIET